MSAPDVLALAREVIEAGEAREKCGKMLPNIGGKCARRKGHTRRCERHIGDAIERDSAHTLDLHDTAAPALARAVVSLSEELSAAKRWADDDTRDEWSDAIHTAFPTRSGSHKEYATAMEMVGARRSKGALVALVNWLLVELAAARRALTGAGS